MTSAKHSRNSDYLRHMRALLLVLFALTATSHVSAQSPHIVHVFPDDMMRPQEMICHMQDGVVRMGNHWRNPVTLTLHNRKVFQGYSTSSFDLLYTIADDMGRIQLRRGEGHWSDDVLYTWHEGAVYIGDSSFGLDLVFTFRPNPLDPQLLELYKEDSRSRFDRLCVFAGQPTPDDLLVLLLAQGLL